MKMSDKLKIVEVLMSFAPRYKNKEITIEIRWYSISVMFVLDEDVKHFSDIWFEDGLEQCIKDAKAIKKEFKDLGKGV